MAMNFLNCLAVPAMGWNEPFDDTGFNTYFINDFQENSWNRFFLVNDTYVFDRKPWQPVPLMIPFGVCYTHKDNGVIKRILIMQNRFYDGKLRTNQTFLAPKVDIVDETGKWGEDLPPSTMFGNFVFNGKYSWRPETDMSDPRPRMWQGFYGTIIYKPWKKNPDGIEDVLDQSLQYTLDVPEEFSIDFAPSGTLNTEVENRRYDYYYEADTFPDPFSNGCTLYGKGSYNDRRLVMHTYFDTFASGEGEDSPLEVWEYDHDAHKMKKTGDTIAFGEPVWQCTASDDNTIIAPGVLISGKTMNLQRNYRMEIISRTPGIKGAWGTVGDNKMSLFANDVQFNGNLESTTIGETSTLTGTYVVDGDELTISCTFKFNGYSTESWVLRTDYWSDLYLVAQPNFTV